MNHVAPDGLGVVVRIILSDRAEAGIAGGGHRLGYGFAQIVLGEGKVERIAVDGSFLAAHTNIFMEGRSLEGTDCFPTTAFPEFQIDAAIPVNPQSLQRIVVGLFLVIVVGRLVCDHHLGLHVTGEPAGAFEAPGPFGLIEPEKITLRGIIRTLYCHRLIGHAGQLQTAIFGVVYKGTTQGLRVSHKIAHDYRGTRHGYPHIGG